MDLDGKSPDDREKRSLSLSQKEFDTDTQVEAWPEVVETTRQIALGDH
jgi:hypothetical protein